LGKRGGEQGDEEYPLFQRRRIFCTFAAESGRKPVRFCIRFAGMSPAKITIHRDKRITNSEYYA